MKRKGKIGKLWNRMMGMVRSMALATVLCAELYAGICPVEVLAQTELAISAPSAILIEASTGQVIFEQNATERRCPASITKIMTLLLIMEQIDAGKLSLDEEIPTSEYASSMGGSQVYLAAGEVQNLDTMLKCIVVASANDASVAVAEYIAGSEQAFVDRMNDRAVELGMLDTHFEDCCGLTESDNHYTCARDVAIMSRELITAHPDIYNYTQIWMEDITHQTNQGSSTFTLSNTNKLLKQYEWTTGLKTGSMSKAKYCISATARRNDIDLIAVVMGSPEPKTRFQDAKVLLNYGFSVSNLYLDENKDLLPDLAVEGGVAEMVPIVYAEEFRYLDIAGNSMEQVEKRMELPEQVQAPVTKGEVAGQAKYYLNGAEIGSVPILYAADVERAVYLDYLWKIFGKFLLGAE